MTALRSPSDNPQMGDRFARVYERTAHRITVPVAQAALDATGPVAGRRVLDIGTGAGALAVLAAAQGASVLAVDIAPGMVRRASAHLKPYAGASARVMDGTAMDLESDAFDATFSIFGVIVFADWRKGLAEQARVTCAGGRGCVATWRVPPGGGPFHVMSAALKTVFPDQTPPPPPAGFAALSDPDTLKRALEDAGFCDVVIDEIKRTWEGPSGETYVEELRDLHSFMPAYARLDDLQRGKVDEMLAAITAGQADVDGRIHLVSPVLIATGNRREG